MAAAKSHQAEWFVWEWDGQICPKDPESFISFLIAIWYHCISCWIILCSSISLSQLTWPKQWGTVLSKKLESSSWGCRVSLTCFFGLHPMLLMLMFGMVTSIRVKLPTTTLRLLCGKPKMAAQKIVGRISLPRHVRRMSVSWQVLSWNDASLPLGSRI